MSRTWLGFGRSDTGVDLHQASSAVEIVSDNCSDSAEPLPGNYGFGSLGVRSKYRLEFN